MKEILGITVYSVKEVAAQLGVTPHTILSYIKTGKLPARKIGGAWHITEENLKAFIKAEPTTP